MVEGNTLSIVQALYDPWSGDTTYHGQPFSTAFPASSGYAANAAWYINDEVLRFAGRRYTRYDLPRLLAPGDVRAMGEYQGVAVFGTGDPEVLYVPVRPGCEFQPYLRVALQTQDRPPRRPSRPPRPSTAPRPPPGLTPAVSDTSFRRRFDSIAGLRYELGGRMHSARARRSEITRGGIDVTFPETMRQGRNTTVTIHIVRDRVTPGAFIMQTETGLEALGLATPDLEERRIMIRDTLPVSSIMRVRLEAGDTVGGPNFSIIPRHRDEKQSVREGLGATWTFSVTPLRHGPQPLDYTVDLLTARDTSTLETRRRTIMVQVNRWWQLRQFTRHYILPISVTGILLPLLVFMARKLWPEGKPDAAVPSRHRTRAKKRKG